MKLLTPICFFILPLIISAGIIFVCPWDCFQVQEVRYLQQRSVTAPWVGPQQPQSAVCFSNPESAAAATLTFRLRTPLLKMLRSKTSSLPRYRGFPPTKSPKMSLFCSKSKEKHKLNQVLEAFLSAERNCNLIYMYAQKVISIGVCLI